MSEPSWVYGCIIYTGVPSKIYQFCELNKAAIEQLPDKVNRREALFLTKNMFTVTMPHDDVIYRHQMIHFGASYNHLYDGWDKWLKHFESLLKTLYWVEANVHANIRGTEQDFYYKADYRPMFEDPPQPIQEWELKLWKFE